MERIASRLLAQGLRTVRLDQRGAGKGLPLARRCYHAGRSEDVRAALEEMHRWSPASPIALVGVSLGGNLALKAAGEMGEHPIPYLERVAAMNPPIDVHRCAVLMAQPRNRVYDQYFVNLLVKDAWQRQRYFPDLPPLAFPRRMTTRLFDDLYTAPRNGFADALDYYRRSSSLPLIGRITVPTLILTVRRPIYRGGTFRRLEGAGKRHGKHLAARRAHRFRRLGRLRRRSLGRVARGGLGDQRGTTLGFLHQPEARARDRNHTPRLHFGLVGGFRFGAKGRSLFSSAAASGWRSHFFSKKPLTLRNHPPTILNVAFTKRTRNRIRRRKPFSDWVSFLSVFDNSAST